MPRSIPVWLRLPPDQQVDHRYLTADEIAALPSGVFYKKKSILTRHRFAKLGLAAPSGPVTLELVDNRGCWRITEEELQRLASAFGIAPGSRGNPGEHAMVVLEAAGLLPHVLPWTVPPDRAAAALQKPQTREDIVRLYRDYTDMAEQGHFSDDSPDLERLHVMVDWVPDAVRVLDLGCNSGAFGERLASRGCVVFGIDLSAPLLRKAASRGTRAVLALAEALPLREHSVDVVLCGEILEHSLAPKLLLAEARRVLMPEGLLVGSIPHGLGQWGHDDLDFHPEHLWAWLPSELNALLACSGFELQRLVEQYFGGDQPDGIVFSARLIG